MMGSAVFPEVSATGRVEVLLDMQRTTIAIAEDAKTVWKCLTSHC